jgi:hypothetical protein
MTEIACRSTFKSKENNQKIRKPSTEELFGKTAYITQDKNELKIFICQLGRFRSSILIHPLHVMVLVVLLITGVIQNRMQSYALALDTTIGISAGYDDNVNATPDESGSAFTTCRLYLSHQFLHEMAYGKSHVYLDGFYRQYAEFDNNMSLNVGADYSCYPGDDRFMVSGLIGAGMYRDNEDAYDEFDQVKVGGKVTYFYTGATRFEFFQLCYWNQYLEPDYEISGYSLDPGSGNSTPIYTLEDREDVYLLSQLGMHHQLHPMFGITLFALYGRLFSTITTENYYGTGGFFSCRLSLSPSWGVSAETSVWRNSFYDNSRTDIYSASGLVMNIFLDRYELFIRSDFIRNDSTLDWETYQRLITQCGVSIFF